MTTPTTDAPSQAALLRELVRLIVTDLCGPIVDPGRVDGDDLWDDSEEGGAPAPADRPRRCCSRHRPG
jgi:hypothetical protein